MSGRQGRDCSGGASHEGVPRGLPGAPPWELAANPPRPYSQGASSGAGGRSPQLSGSVPTAGLSAKPGPQTRPHRGMGRMRPFRGLSQRRGAKAGRLRRHLSVPPGLEADRNNSAPTAPRGLGSFPFFPLPVTGNTQAPASEAAAGSGGTSAPPAPAGAPCGRAGCGWLLRASRGSRPDYLGGSPRSGLQGHPLPRRGSGRGSRSARWGPEEQTEQRGSDQHPRPPSPHHSCAPKGDPAPPRGLGGGRETS